MSATRLTAISDYSDIVLNVFRYILLFQQQLRETDYTRQRIVDFVGNARRHLTHGSQSACYLGFLLELLFSLSPPVCVR